LLHCCNRVTIVTALSSKHNYFRHCKCESSSKLSEMIRPQSEEYINSETRVAVSKSRVIEEQVVSRLKRKLSCDPLDLTGDAVLNVCAKRQRMEEICRNLAIGKCLQILKVTFSTKYFYITTTPHECKLQVSQWPRVLRRRSAAARFLGSRVRIPFGTWMFVCCVCMSCCPV
jgi:hypothetical protein